MIKNILLGTDGSACSETACAYAIDLARRLDAQLEAVHVVDSRMMDYPLIAPQSGIVTWNPGLTNHLQDLLRKRGEELLRKVSEQGRAGGVSMVVTLEFGHPAQVLSDIQRRTELVVLGRQGEQARTAPEITGSTMERFVRRATRPCLVTPAAFQPFSRVLLGVDGSAAAGRALNAAIDLSNALSLPLILLGVAEREADLPLAQQTVMEAHTLARAHDCAAASLTATGAPATCILEQAHSTQSDLIVLGSHGHGWIYDRLIGSVAAHVISRAHIPVLMVP